MKLEREEIEQELLQATPEERAIIEAELALDPLADEPEGRLWQGAHRLRPVPGFGSAGAVGVRRVHPRRAGGGGVRNMTRLVGVGFAFLAVGCGARHPEAPRGAHPPNDAVVVPYPSPAGQGRRGFRRNPRPLASGPTVTGTLTDRWEWQAGEWVVPTAHCRLAQGRAAPARRPALARAPALVPGQTSLCWDPQSACPRPPACASPAAVSGSGGGSGAVS